MWPATATSRGLRRTRRTAVGAPGEPDREPEIIDPDVDLRDPVQRAETHPHAWDLLAVIAAGGVVGAEARYGIDRAVPYGASGFPWATLLINVVGCLLIGVLMVTVLELSSPHRLVRPFLGVGLLGGFTTFSTFAVDAERLVRLHHPLLALGYVATSLVSCLVAVYVATVVTRVIGRLVLERDLRRRDREGARSR